MKGILGRKLGMSQVFGTNGKMVPVTAIEILPNTVLQVKTLDNDGYVATQLGVQDKREALMNKPEMGHFNKVKAKPKRFVKEIRGMSGYEPGKEINPTDLFQPGQIVDITGIVKGKGFQGGVKRHNYARGPMGHGSGYHRGAGSMGAIVNRIFKSKKMPGHMGNVKRTIQNLEIVQIDEPNHLMLIKGSVPGNNNDFIIVKENAKKIKAKAAVELVNRVTK